MNRITPELRKLAATLADWLDPAIGIPAAYLFGSRVRGDHRANSDVDVRLFLHEWLPDAATMHWWTEQNACDFSELKQRLPGPLTIHRETSDAADTDIRRGMRTPVLVDRRIVCVWTPKKPQHALSAPPKN